MCPRVGKEKKSGWLLLFDGQTLNGWMTSDQKPSRRPVEEGCLNPHKSGHYMLVHTQQWADFVLALDFKITNGKIKVPTAPGMGLEIDPEYLSQATTVCKVDKPGRMGGSGSGG